MKLKSTFVPIASVEISVGLVTSGAAVGVKVGVNVGSGAPTGEILTLPRSCT